MSLKGSLIGEDGSPKCFLEIEFLPNLSYNKKLNKSR